MKRLMFLCVLLIHTLSHGQGMNHHWLLGSYNLVSDPKGRILFDSIGYTLINENRKMVFKGAQSNISDSIGNFLMSSNGSWVANANNDTMQNGDNLNPSSFTSSWPYGFPINFMNIFLNYPGDTNKYLLFHQTMWQSLSPCKSGFYKSIIDLSLDSGLGAVIQKNDTLLADTLSMGIGACKHANGRDWWVFTIRDYNPIAYTYLITPYGIDTMFTQNMGFISNTYGNVSGIIFSPNGKKMIFSTPINQSPSGTVLLFDFDRCTGLFSNMHSFAISPGAYLYGLAFSPSGKYAYACSSHNIFQIDVDSLTFSIVATYDGYISPPTDPCCPTTFFGMYLAANGKIYITSGSSVQHITEMNYPDSADTACDVQQHAIDLVNYLYLRTVPNHPNYYLGCDTTSGCACLYSGVEENEKYDFRFRIYPNPVTSNSLHIGYILPQNKAGGFFIYDVTGKVVFNYNLPQWSNEQSFSLPDLSNGVYNCVIKSANYRASKKLIVINE